MSSRRSLTPSENEAVRDAVGRLVAKEGSQARVAEKLDIKPGVLSMFLRRKSGTSDALVEKLVTLTGLSREQIFASAAYEHPMLPKGHSATWIFLGLAEKLADQLGLTVRALTASPTPSEIDLVVKRGEAVAQILEFLAFMYMIPPRAERGPDMPAPETLTEAMVAYQLCGNVAGIARHLLAAAFGTPDQQAELRGTGVRLATAIAVPVDRSKIRDRTMADMVRAVDAAV